VTEIWAQPRRNVRVHGPSRGCNGARPTIDSTLRAGRSCGGGQRWWGYWVEPR
jgi:hypothetical protein